MYGVVLISRFFKNRNYLSLRGALTCSFLEMWGNYTDLTNIFIINIVRWNLWTWKMDTAICKAHCFTLCHPIARCHFYSANDLKTFHFFTLSKSLLIFENIIDLEAQIWLHTKKIRHRIDFNFSSLVPKLKGGQKSHKNQKF